MADRMRLLELCLRESAAAFSWSLSGNYLTCARGNLAFILMPGLSEQGVEYTLMYRYAEFDKIYRALTLSNIYPGIELARGSQTVSSWSLLGISASMRTVMKKIERFAEELSGKIVTLDDNLRFLNYIQTRALRRGETPPPITVELILTKLLSGDNSGAAAVAGDALLSGDRGDGLYSAVFDYVKRKNGH